MNKFQQLLGVTLSLLVASPTSAGLIIYGVDAIGHHDSRLFTLNLDTGDFGWHSERLRGLDIEGLASRQSQIYTITKPKGQSLSFASLDYARGTVQILSPLNFDTGKKSKVTGMTTDPLTGEIWGFLAKRGFVSLDPGGDWELRIPFTQNIAGLAISQNGETLYGLHGRKIYAADILTGEISHLTTLPIIEGATHYNSLEMLPSGVLGGFVNLDSGVAFYTYDLLTSTMTTRYYDGLPLRDVKAFTVTSTLSLAAVPAPGTGVILGGLLALNRRRRRS